MRTTRLLVALIVTWTFAISSTTQVSAQSQAASTASFKNLMFRLLPFEAGRSDTGGGPDTRATPTPQPTTPPQEPQDQERSATSDIVDELGRKRGTLTLRQRGNTPTLRIEFEAQQPNQNEYYEIWLVRETPPDWISLGRAIESSPPAATRRFTNQTTSLSNVTLRDHTKLRITLEKDDGDPRPSRQIVLRADIPVISEPTQEPTQAPPPTAPPDTSPTSPQSEPTAQPTQPPDRNQQIRQVIDTISEEAIRDYLGNLVDDDDTPGPDETQTRWTGASGNNTEAQYIKSTLEGAGLDVTLQPFSVRGAQTNNIIARLDGAKTNEVYLVTAHMDSTAQSDNSTDPAPGADDNGSGTVAVMEIASAIAQAGLDLNYSLEFVLFSGEEQGILGSQQYVRSLPAGKRVKGVINLDMIGNRGARGDCVDFKYKPYNGGNVLSSAVVQNNQTFGIGLTTASRQSSNGQSDHKPFWDAGIPAIFGTECDFSPVYHSVDDKTDKINFAQITKAAKAVAATLAQAALGE